MILNNIQKEFINNKLESLNKSKFRSSFHLRNYMIDYIDKIGLDEVENHCRKFIQERLSPYPTPNDGHQTPTKNHPVFISEHATATCCRKCLYKWHNIPMNRKLTTKEENFIVALIMEWIKKEYKRKK